MATLHAFALKLNQANKLGGRIRQGERSSIVTSSGRETHTTKRTGETGEEETRQGFLLRYFRVFNLDQTEGIKDALGLTESPGTCAKHRSL